jgi:aspartyl-tRNA(Asn)/glutamyl-tRNA(Gln) amidotransferase subunit C
MTTDIQTLRKLAHLARLEFDESREQEMLHDINKILIWVDKLRELETEAVEPLIHISQEVNVMRQDKAQNSVSPEDGLRSAPRKDAEYFRVPKVME